ncbi:hypothetical protein RJ640_019097 [Escallonia rubra]|uniref:Uncharacterized protein n=1 Tax=Escallonia rubra TaxID=112253 RepID=A0AA88RRA5_9ASTE|nr:hypothetical protein RJ640_019097 [Escallonia rubra]
MSEPEQGYHSSLPESKELTATPPQPPLMMDLDIDLDGSWTFDQIFRSDPTSPFHLSAAEQPCSPLWAFSDVNDDKPAGNAPSTSAGGSALTVLLLAFYSLCNLDSVTESTSKNDDKRRLPLAVLGLMPSEDLYGSFAIKERMAQALRHFKASAEQHVLAQVWAPVKKGDRYVLTTSGQPFVLDPSSSGLHHYRMVSLMYMFSVDEQSEGSLGIPGRVFQKKLPEWTPNVQYYSSIEYPRLNHALHYNVQGTVALPVFERSGQSCVGVVELIMTKQKINYAPEVDKVCKALECFSCIVFSKAYLLNYACKQFRNEGRQNALAEILEILTLVSETHNFPLAQTWVPCRHRNVLANGGGLRKSCSSFDGSCMGQVCMSTTDVAFYVVDAHMWGFRDACAEHHLQKGQGVAGRAFASHASCFCEDISRFSKTEYPLVHYARMFGLTSSFAICLRSTHTGDDEYILEFFMPLNTVNSNNQQMLLDSLLATMKQHFRSLSVASGKQHEEGRSVEVIEASIYEELDPRLESVQISHSKLSPPEPHALPNGGAMVHYDSLECEIMVELDAVLNVGGTVGIQTGAPVSENKDTIKKSERKRGKAEKAISLEVLQQHFAGSLKDAAKSLGVCPTTMKRICRQHGISRWPSRKINKVNRSLTKLKRVIESVHGADGAFTLTSIASSSLPVVPWATSLNGSNQQNSPGYKPSELEAKNIMPSQQTPRDGNSEIANEVLGGVILGSEDLIHMRSGYLLELDEGSNRSKTGSGSREESTGTRTSHASCQGSPCPHVESSPQSDEVAFPIIEHRIELGSSLELACQPREQHNMLAASIPDAIVTAQPQEPFGGMLVEDAGSSHDLANLCSAGLALLEERAPEYSWTDPPRSDEVPKESVMATNANITPCFPARPEVKTVTIKATYREDIIRFRLSLDSGVDKLKDEVAARLKLEMGTFDIKYLDDDHEWVLIACDEDLQECLDVSRSSGSSIIRLLVHDIMANLGSSCESSG